MGPGAETLQVVLLSALVALGMRFARGESARLYPDGNGGDEEEVVEDCVVVTSDGLRFVPDDDAVQVLPPGAPADIMPVRGVRGFDLGALVFLRPTPVHPRSGRPLPSWRPGERLVAGDLIGARLAQGGEGEAPWRVEALGRDRDFRAWAFESEDAAHAALSMLRRHVVRRPLFDSTHAWPLRPVDFEESLDALLRTGEEVRTGAGDWTVSMAGGEWLRLPPREEQP